MKLLLIEWLDARSHGNAWTHEEDFAPGLARCRSVGWLHGEDRASLTLVSSLAPEQVGGDITIPKACIVKRTTLKA